MVGSLESGGVLLTQAADMFERGGRRLRGGARRIGPGAITEGEQETNAGNALIHDCEAQLGTEDTLAGTVTLDHSCRHSVPGIGCRGSQTARRGGPWA